MQTAIYYFSSSVLWPLFVSCSPYRRRGRTRLSTLARLLTMTGARAPPAILLYRAKHRQTRTPRRDLLRSPPPLCTREFRDSAERARTRGRLCYQPPNSLRLSALCSAPLRLLHAARGAHPVRGPALPVSVFLNIGGGGGGARHAGGGGGGQTAGG